MVSLAGSAQEAFTFEGSYVGDAYYNFDGGLKKGGGFMGMGNIAIGFDTHKAGGWRGGSFFINGASIHGKSLTENYLGDMQVVSNIDAGEHAYLHELWYRQRLGRVSLTLGLQDLNADFMVSEGAGEFINSSFGVPSVIAVGIPVPIFPLTGLGVAARWDISDKVWQGALFDGDQTPFERNPNNVRWHFGDGDGALIMTELHLNGRYKVGAYYHTMEDNYGFYALADQPLGERASLFGQLAVASKSKNQNHYYLGLGANFVAGERSSLGLAMAHAGLHEMPRKHETSLEFYYKYALGERIALQPDLQYIIHPAGSGERLNNALVGMLRLHVNF